MKKLLLFQLIFFLTTLAQAQKIKDVKIGEQIWMSENLNVDKFRNGDPIPQAKTAEEWKKAGEEGKPAWCYYENNPKNGKKYGKLYNWFAVNDPRGLAPEGWSVATDVEFENLSDFLDGVYLSSKKMKSKKDWNSTTDPYSNESRSINNNGNNTSGFNGRPAGYISEKGEFFNLNYGSSWWTATEYSKYNKDAAKKYQGKEAYYWNLNRELQGLKKDKKFGLSVRCVKENVILNISNNKTSESTIEQKINEIKIGEQIWMAENLNVSTFRNGDPIPEVKNKDEWEKAGNEGRPAWCYYHNKEENGKKYGKLYNWFAVNDPSGLAPEGWHVATKDEWAKLYDYLGGKNVAETKMKSKEGWIENFYDFKRTKGTNESLFNGMPGGVRLNSGVFYDLGKNSYWWTATKGRQKAYYGSDFEIEGPFSCLLGPDDHELISKSVQDFDFGESVRCVKD
jgi:uncharacterized protein (TIGR02145 family)